jgi:hypothetical protein
MERPPLRTSISRLDSCLLAAWGGTMAGRDDGFEASYDGISLRFGLSRVLRAQGNNQLAFANGVTKVLKDRLTKPIDPRLSVTIGREIPHSLGH